MHSIPPSPFDLVFPRTLRVRPWLLAELPELVGPVVARLAGRGITPLTIHLRVPGPAGAVPPIPGIQIVDGPVDSRPLLESAGEHEGDWRGRSDPAARLVVSRRAEMRGAYRPPVLPAALVLEVDAVERWWERPWTPRIRVVGSPALEPWAGAIAPYALVTALLRGLQRLRLTIGLARWARALAARPRA